jgi:uncharacterized protein YyaL (SSP411 family)
MAKFDRRFTRDEFVKEMVTHLKDMPPGFTQSRKNLEAIAEYKAEQYQKAIEALDMAANKLKKLNEANTDPTIKQETEAAIKSIDEAISAYGVASFGFNSQWTFMNGNNEK